MDYDKFPFLVDPSILPPIYLQIYKYLCFSESNMVDSGKLFKFIEQCGLTMTQINLTFQQCSINKNTAIPKEKTIIFLVLAAIILNGNKNTTLETIEGMKKPPIFRLPLFLKKQIENLEENNIWTQNFNSFNLGSSSVSMFPDLDNLKITPIPNLVANKAQSASSILDLDFDLLLNPKSLTSTQKIEFKPETTTVVPVSIDTKPIERSTNVSNLYNYFEDQFEIQDEYVTSWTKCLESINRCFKNTIETIKKHNLNQKEIQFCLTQEKSNHHFKALCEIHLIADRINQSSKNTGKFNDSLSLQKLIEESSSLWNTLKTFLNCSLYSDNSYNIVKDNDNYCGICLLSSLDISSKNDRNPIIRQNNEKLLLDNLPLIPFTTSFYHTTCANFWLNRVNLSIPRLQKISLKDSLI